MSSKLPSAQGDAAQTSEAAAATATATATAGAGNHTAATVETPSAGAITPADRADFVAAEDVAGSVPNEAANEAPNEAANDAPSEASTEACSEASSEAPVAMPKATPGADEPTAAVASSSASKPATDSAGSAGADAAISDAPGSGALKPPSAARRRRRGRPLLLLLLLLLLIAADAWRQLHAPLAMSQATTAELASGERFDHWLAGLDARGLFATERQRWYLSAYARATRATVLIKAGEYRLDVDATPLALLTLLQSGKVVLHELRLTEGWRFAQAWATIQQDPNIQHSLRDATPVDVMRALSQPDLDAEGQLFPDTYRFPKNTSDLVLLRQANSALQKILAAEWSARAPDLPYDSPQQALVMASIVEKETAAPTERPQIAGVFVRRLQMGMRLQTDPAVIYGVGAAYDGSLHTRDLQTDTPYNTYLRVGLPPTPICLPGRESIHAALHPEGGHALYFVSRGDGTHQFSDTLDEHNAAVRRYIPGAR